MSKLSIISGLLSASSGGPAKVVAEHAIAMKKYFEVSILGLGKSDLNDKDIRVKEFTLSSPKRWYFAKKLQAEINREASEGSVLHAHMLWDYPVFAAGRAAKKYGTPLVVTPHGSIATPWRYNSVHKRLYKHLVLNTLFESVSCMHVFNKEEAQGALEFGVPCEINIIPNGLPLQDYLNKSNPQEAIDKFPEIGIESQKFFLYLGRLWGDKGLDLLPDSFAKFCKENRSNDWNLVIAGPDYRFYKSKLESQIARNQFSSKIFLLPEVGGNLKRSLISACNCLVLPSRGEGFSISILEAMAASKPVIFSTPCNMKELQSAGGGIEVEYDSNSLAEGLTQIASMKEGERNSMGGKGNLLGQNKFTLESVSESLCSMYRKALNRC